MAALTLLSPGLTNMSAVSWNWAPLEWLSSWLLLSLWSFILGCFMAWVSQCSFSEKASPMHKCLSRACLRNICWCPLPKQDTWPNPDSVRKDYTRDGYQEEWLSRGQCTVMCMCVCVCAHSVTQLCLTLWDPMDCSPPGSSVHAVSQARILEWVLIPGDLLDPGIKLISPALAGGFFTTWATWEALPQHIQGHHFQVQSKKI